MSEAPVFIGGPDRCGKTLLAALLGSHSRIAIPIVGSNLWTYFAGQFGDLAADENLDRCLAALRTYKHARFLDPDFGRLRRDMLQGERTYARLFALIHAQFAERAGKPRWGDQTGLIERYADQIFEAYAGARMVHMLRDPRDRYEASLALWPKGRGRAGAAAARWRYSARLAQRNSRRHPDRYRVLRYEDLVTDPAGTLRQVTAFLGEEYEPAMLDMADAPTYRRKLAGGQMPPAGAALISPDHIGGYRGRVPTAELAFLESVLAPEMRTFGYVPDRASLGPRDSWVYRAWVMPSNRLRMLAWTGLETVQHRYPRLVGRQPIRAKVVGAE